MPAAPLQNPTPVSSPTPLPAASVGPNPPAKRLWLLLKLFLVPAAVVCLPTLFVSYFFGQRPQPKTTSEAAFSGLRESLERAARERLPEKGTSFGARFEDLSLPCPPPEAGTRLDALRKLALGCGGTLTDEGADATGQHLLVELPEANLPRFRQDAAAPVAAPVPDPTASPAAGDRVFLRVTLVLAPPPAS